MLREKIEESGEHSEVGRSVAMADAKANFSSLITRVQKRHIPVTILRRGVLVAQITPIARSQVTPLRGSMAGTTRESGDIVGSLGVEWTVDGA